MRETMRLRMCEGLLNLAFRLDVSRCDFFDTSSRCDNLEPPGTGIYTVHIHA